MFISKKFTLRSIINFTKGQTIPLFLWSCFAVCFTELLHYYDFEGFKMPWLPVSIIGTAVAFYVGFKNNNAYDRTWEARKIWGGIVNDSRSFGSEVLALIHEQGVPRSLIFRHIAWLKILQGQLRMDRTWEKPKTRLKQFSMYMDDQWRNAMVERLRPLLDQEDLEQI